MKDGLSGTVNSICKGSVVGGSVRKPAARMWCEMAAAEGDRGKTRRGPLG